MLYQRQDEDIIITLLVFPDDVPTFEEYIHYADPEPDLTNETINDKLPEVNFSKLIGS